MTDHKVEKQQVEKADDMHGEDKLAIKDTTQEEHSDSPIESTDKDKDLDGKELGQAMAEAEHEAAQPIQSPASKKGKFVWTKKKIVLAVTAAVIVIAGILAAVPVTRYAIAGVFIKRDFTVTLHDSKTNKPISNVAVDIAGGASTTTDAKGVATFKSIPVGAKKLTMHKKYYKDLSIEQTIGITGSNPSFDFAVEATGRQVPVKVINKVSQQPVEGADITADGTSSKTDKNGEAVLVLPADKSTLDATVGLGGYNKLSVTITITEQKDDKNTFAAVPTGKLYFLSKRSGTIDVLKSDLDGGKVETVLKGTGKEDELGTVLLASRDWKYLALKATRDSDRPKLYLITTATDKLTVIDEGDADFTPVGWYNNYFTYTIHRDKLKQWQPKQYAIKSYNASSGSLNVLDETNAVGSDQTKFAYEYLGNVYLLDNKVFFTKDWNTGELNMLDGKNNTVVTVQPDGGNKKVVLSLDANSGSYFETARLYKPQEIYLEGQVKNQDTFWEYDDAKLTETKDIKADNFYSDYYATYLLSPSGQKTFWYEPRDGKNTLFIGDKDGENGKEIATLSEYKPYGWYGEGYLLVSKGGSELYIMSVANPGSPIKVTDYHKPQASFAGYGYGYGGL